MTSMLSDETIQKLEKLTEGVTLPKNVDRVYDYIWYGEKAANRYNSLLGYTMRVALMKIKRAPNGSIELIMKLALKARSITRNEVKSFVESIVDSLEK